MTLSRSLLGSLALLLAVVGFESASAQGSFKKVFVVKDQTALAQLSQGVAAVIFVVSDDDSFEGGTEMAKELEGIARVAVINSKSKNGDALIKQIGGEGALYLAKPYGVEEKITGYKVLEEAKAAALDSLPKDTVESITDYVLIQKFLVTTSQETLLPVLLFVDKEDDNSIPPLMTKLSYWVEDSFKLAVVPNASPELKQQLGVKSTPLLIAMIPSPQEDPSGGAPQMGFSGAPYDKNQFGAMKFKNVLKFLSAVRNEMTQKGFYKDRDEKAQSKPTKPTKEVKMVPLFEYTADTPDACSSGKLGLCIITVLDGSPLNDQKDAQLEVIKSVQEAPSMKGRILTFFWVDHTCHPSFSQHFNIDGGVLPSVLAVSAKKSAFAQHVGAFDKAKISGFIGGVLSGKVRISTLPGDGTFPIISSDDNCETAHAALMPVEEEDLSDLDDIMAEMRADEEAAAKEADAAADTKESEEEDKELEEKKKRAQAEAERMNKWSAKKKGTKKKKKKNKKKKKKAKTEL